MVSEVTPPQAPQPTAIGGKGRTLHTRGETITGAKGGIIDAVGEAAQIGHSSAESAPRVRLRKGDTTPIADVVSRNVNRLSRERVSHVAAPTTKPDARVLSLLGLHWG